MMVTSTSLILVFPPFRIRRWHWPHVRRPVCRTPRGQPGNGMRAEGTGLRLAANGRVASLQHMRRHIRPNGRDHPARTTRSRRLCEDGQPRPQVQLAAPPVSEHADRVVALRHERAPVQLLTWRYCADPSGQGSSQDHIGARGVTENPELRAEPRIEISRLYWPSARVQADIKVEMSAVSKSGEQRQ